VLFTDFTDDTDWLPSDTTRIRVIRAIRRQSLAPFASLRETLREKRGEVIIISRRGAESAKGF